MDSAEPTLFPLPESEIVRELKTPFERYMLFMQAAESQGGLIPRTVLPLVLGVSQQRCSQLIDAKRFQTFQLFGQVFVTGESLEAFCASERKSGRPVKKPSKWTMLKAAAAGYPALKKAMTKPRKK